MDKPCSSDGFIQMKRTKSTLPASMDTLVLRRSARSEALPNKCQQRSIQVVSRAARINIQVHKHSF
ncbi:hypothetical protein PHMEG_00016139 [Phytophthora megakarya]|uniref:Uncharacterized protein n=1 Tax=Phytophthora megakarya TaxID=4795 RepID=A0A225W007_9STRA|nr:hypothetical protein PHMEG_00016139 [Phytophthora megakarya]